MEILRLANFTQHSPQLISNLFILPKQEVTIWDRKIDRES